MPGTKTTQIILDFLCFSGLSKLSRSFAGGVGAILMLHRVEPGKPSSDFNPNVHLSVKPEFLNKLLTSLAGSNIDFVSLDEAVGRISSGSSERRFVAITLDDGYRDNLLHAAPVFRKHNAPYTIFVAPGLVDGRATLWWEDLERLIVGQSEIEIEFPSGIAKFVTGTGREKSDAFNALLHRLTNEVDEEEQRKIMARICNKYVVDAENHRAASIMNWDELREIGADPLCTLGAHTIHHYAVARLSPSECRDELLHSAKEIELKTGRQPKHFAYPYGYEAAAGSRDFSIARECGFQSAVTTRHGVCYKEHSKYLAALPRISVNGLFQKERYVKTLLSGAPTIIQNRGKKLNIS